MKKYTGEDLKNLLIDMIVVFGACAAGSFATVGIMLPNGLTSGGLTGVVRIIQTVIPLDFSVMYYIGAILILVVCALALGLKEAKKIAVMSIMYPTVMVIFERLNFQLLEETDVFLAAIYCGIFFGACSGLAFTRGYSSGGSDTVAKIIQKKLLPQVSVSKLLMVLDVSIIGISGLIFGRNIALYAIITTVIISKTIDFILFGLETRIVQLEIITEHHETITDFIMHDMERGVSIETIVGAYTGKEKKKLLVLCSPREGLLIKKKVGSLDKKALVTMIHVDSVWGHGAGFNDIDKDDDN